MIFGKTRMELKVGIFVFIGIILLTFFILSIGGFQTWTSRYKVIFVYNFINGVRVGAPVRFAGFDVGVVDDIKLEFDPASEETKVNLICSVKKEVKIPMDSTVEINTLGLLGEKYVEIMPGRDYSKLLLNNQKLNGANPISMTEVTALAKGIIEDISENLKMIKNKEGTVGKLLYDDALYKELEAALRNKEGTVGRLFYDDSIYKDIQELISDIKRHPWKLFFKPKEKKAKK